MALHFPLEMKLPPGAMWIEECIAEQVVSSKIQTLHLNRFERIAKLPLPLFVFKMTAEQVARYEEVIRSRISADAFKKCKNKLADGLGVEVYYYPKLPVRVADLFFGNTRETFEEDILPNKIETVFQEWALLFSDILCLDYMPYAPWHRGMGGCCDRGNACIDGGFNDLLTLVPFNAIPNDVLFQRCLLASIRMLAESMEAMAAASIRMPVAVESDAKHIAATFIAERLREHVSATERDGHVVDSRLRRFVDTPTVADIVDALHDVQQHRNMPTQFVGETETRRS
jgi:hypothetical protein